MIETDWQGCYRDGWQGLIVDAAFQHPAKFSRALIRRIYEHCREEGWLTPGDHVLDCFGGVGLGALDCMRIGCHFIGIELEPKFVALAEQNIALWHRRFHRLPNWGTARVFQGDSRTLLAWSFAGGQVEGVIGSPPYAEQQSGGGIAIHGTPHQTDKSIAPVGYQIAGDNAANLGNLPDKGFAAAVGSPPFSHPNEQPVASQSRLLKEGYEAFKSPRKMERGETPGQLAAMREGTVDAAISSPPYETGGHHPDQTGAWGGQAQANTKEQAGYGTSRGQMGKMPEGPFDAVCSSPPWERTLESGGGINVDKLYDGMVEKHGRSNTPEDRAKQVQLMSRRIQGRIYGQEQDNLGNSSGDTFWLAARQILEQVHGCLRPGGHAVWVVKDFVRKGKIVPFSDQWRQLCEAVGFRTLHEHRALLTEDYGTQRTTDNGDQHRRVKRASFFRRLAERKGSPEINWETVWCMDRP
mgnify:CR=1 FL=1